MGEEFADSLHYRWLNKKVHESKLLDDMEDLSRWSKRGIAQCELTRERSISGASSLRLQTNLRDEAKITSSPGGRMMGEAGVVLKFSPPQDWSAYNRIALWIYVHPTDFRVHPFYLSFQCRDAADEITGPRYNSVIQGLTAGQWNYVLWEIPNLKRDQVTEFQIAKFLTGHHAGEEGKVVYDIDRLELQRVDAEDYEGWEVAEGKIAYQHHGYMPNQSKRALASDLQAALFQLRDAHSGKVILTKPVERLKNERGEFQVMDFSEVTDKGEYFLWAGDRTSRPFRIDESIWLEPIRKALNFYYVQRCGFDVPGVHPVCHEDCQGIHNGVKKVINGGWHDAGDLSQGSFRTDMSVYSMLQLYRHLELCEIEAPLRDRLLEEARWGLDWVLKTRFGDGYRITWNGLGFYTDGILGTKDDVTKEAQNSPWENFTASAAETLASETWKKRDPALAQECLKAAMEDWEAAVALQERWLDEGTVVLTGGGIIDNKATFYHRWFSGGTYLTLSWGVLSSIHLYQATGEKQYADRALEYGGVLVRCQEKAFQEGIPLTGYFYTSPDKLAIVNHRHAAFEESPLLALWALCETFPQHDNWMDWYTASVLHSTYNLKRGSEYSAPYRVLPNAVFRRSDFDLVPDDDLREAMLRQYEDGVRLSDHYRLRMFPIWSTKTHHGNTAVQLSQSMALVASSELQNDPSLEDLARAQLQWVFGGNPFSQTIMYGQGYDYPPLYAYNPGDVVGSLPVGFECVKNDEPYWSASNHSTFKEIWVVPVNKFLWNVAYLGMPACVKGRIAGASSREIKFDAMHSSASQTIRTDRDGRFKTVLPAGEYVMESGTVSRQMTLVSGGRYDLDIDPSHWASINVRVRSVDRKTRRVSIQAEAKGTGQHALTLHVSNGTTTEPVRHIDLQAERENPVVWEVLVDRPNEPWTALVSVDGDRKQSRTLTGTVIPETGL